MTTIHCAGHKSRLLLLLLNAPALWVGCRHTRGFADGNFSKPAAGAHPRSCSRNFDQPAFILAYNNLQPLRVKDSAATTRSAARSKLSPSLHANSFGFEDFGLTGERGESVKALSGGHVTH